MLGMYLRAKCLYDNALCRYFNLHVYYQTFQVLSRLTSHFFKVTRINML